MAVEVELVSLDKATEILERALELREPGRQERLNRQVEEHEAKQTKLEEAKQEARAAGVRLDEDRFDLATALMGPEECKYVTVGDESSLEMASKSFGRTVVKDTALSREHTRRALTPLNRELKDARVSLYREEMVRERWHFSPDPIVISEEGYILNGQHRLAAAAQLVWNGNAPQFLVVWGVDKKTALLMDEASRSANDRRDIALGFAEVAS